MDRIAFAVSRREKVPHYKADGREGGVDRSLAAGRVMAALVALAFVAAGAAEGGNGCVDCSTPGSCITITKEPASQQVPSGCPATFTITISSSEDICDQFVTVTDPLTPSCDMMFESEGPVSESYDCTTGALTSDLPNVAMVAGDTCCDPNTRATDASDTAVVDVLIPGIGITKEPATQTIVAGQMAMFTITVTNTGEVPLHSVAVTDSETADCNRAPGILTPPDLPPGEFTSYDCTTGALTMGFTNTATVTAEYDCGGQAPPPGPVSPMTVEAMDSAEVVVEVLTCITEPTTTGTGIEEVCLTGGGLTCGFAESAAVDPATLPSPPAGVDFPHGMVSFTASNCTPGSTVTFTATYPATLPAGTVFYKFGPEPGTPPPDHFFVFPATIAGDTATFSITDGGPGDADLTVNGTIVDPSGPGAPVGIPTLPAWAMVLLVLGLAAVAMAMVKKRAGA